MADQNHMPEHMPEQMAKHGQDLVASTVAHTEHANVHHGYDHLYQNPAFWVAMAIITFFVFLVWKKIPVMVGKILDDKSNAIAEQLDNARILREEASSLLAKYRRDQRDAEKNAAEMITRAQAEADLLTGEAKIYIEDMIQRRTKLSEQKIAQSEANAIKEIQQVAVRVAISAAKELIGDNLKKDGRDALIATSIDRLDRQLH